MRGSGMFASTLQSRFFFGDAATAVAGDGSDFFGQNASFFVLEGGGGVADGVNVAQEVIGEFRISGLLFESAGTIQSKGIGVLP